MKKIIIVILFIITAGKITYGQIAFESGLNMANLALKAGGTKVNTSFKPGFAFGVVADTRLSQHIYFQPGAFYEMTGCKTTTDPKGSYYLNTVNVPLNIEYKTGEKCGRRFFAGAGPYVSYNISGNYTTVAYDNIPSTSTPITIGTGNTSNIKAVDMGVGVNVGYILKNKLYARARYQQGLINLFPNGNSDNSIKSSEIGVTIGYIFGKCNAYHVHYARSPGSHWRGMSKSKYSRRVQHTW